MNKKISLGAAIAFTVIMVAMTYSVTMVSSMGNFNDKVNNLRERESFYSKLAEIDSITRQNYIGTIDESLLMNEEAKGFIAGLDDPYAAYYDAAAYDRLLQDYSGDRVQIGIVTKMNEEGYIEVTEVYPDSPAQAAGIEPGDLIVKIDDTDITSDNYIEAVGMLKDKPGTQMTIILRKGVEDSTLVMTRRFVETPSISTTMLDGSIGMVKIKEFNDSTPDQFSKMVDRLIDEGAYGLVFDVRGVSRGTLRSVAQVLDKLLPEGVLVSSTDKTGVTTVLETSDARQVELPMAVLVNDKTSGEAELFAVAIKDYNKGKIIGVRTAGKGTMQTIFPLTDGSAIRLTTARYNPPVSPSFDKEGVTPDFEVRNTDDALAAADPMEYDLQLKKAMEVISVAMNAADTPAQDASEPEESSSAASSRPASSSSDVDSEDEEESSSRSSAPSGPVDSSASSAVSSRAQSSSSASSSAVSSGSSSDLAGSEASGG